MQRDQGFRKFHIRHGKEEKAVDMSSESLPGTDRSKVAASFGSVASDSGLTVLAFVATRFVPEHIATKTNAGRRHYQAILKHVLEPAEVNRIFATGNSVSKAKLNENPNWPYLSHISLNQVTSEHVQQLISAAICKRYSAQTIKHIRNVIRAIFSHAMKEHCFTGENPAASILLPGMNRRESHALSLAQTTQLLERMHYPEREVALMAILTSMSIAEICGLQWRYVNLTDYFLTREGVPIPERSIAVRNQWYRGELSEVPASRKKDHPISPLLLKVLRNQFQSRSGGWHDFVLTTKSGRPINQINLAARRLKRIGNQLGMPWISWQVLRRTRRSLYSELEARVQEHLSRSIFPFPAVDSRPGWNREPHRF
jgi:integrase